MKVRIAAQKYLTWTFSRHFINYRHASTVFFVVEPMQACISADCDMEIFAFVGSIVCASTHNMKRT